MFVEPQGEGFGVSLELQAGIVKSTEDRADVRFVDERAEALDDAGVVRRDGLLVAIGPAVVEDGHTVISIGAGRSKGSVVQWRFELVDDDDDGWSLAAPPVELEA